ncbi:hypothetical protein ZOSMA_40G00100 [Zostera marina]|uniref:DUF642 domain-containing protein n=1 Tax=Zostera marina TaxID=29655 RepID=A0A0K9P562_ZOSMR|nr:hypothetical protein ZOSMA_40G00100 [Zostera marina]
MYYSISFGAARTCAQAEKLNISVTPDFGVLPIQTMYSSNGWDTYAWGFRADFSQVDLVLHNTGIEEDPACGPLVDSIAVKTLYPPRRINQNVLKNGGFEEGPYIFPNNSWGVLVPPNIEDSHSPLPGWIIESVKAVKYIDSAHFSVPVDTPLYASASPTPTLHINSCTCRTFEISETQGHMGNFPFWLTQTHLVF